MRLLALAGDDELLDLRRQLVGVSHRPARAIGQRLEPMLLVPIEDLVAVFRETPNSRQTSVIASPSRSRATNRKRASITEHSFQGIDTSRRACLAGGVTHVSGTTCHPCLGPLSVRGADKVLNCAFRLGVMARASRELAITHLAQHPAQCLLGDDGAEFLENPLAEIDDPPAHDPVTRRDWAARLREPAAAGLVLGADSLRRLLCLSHRLTRHQKREEPLLWRTALPLSRPRKLAGALEFLPSERYARNSFAGTITQASSITRNVRQ